MPAPRVSPSFQKAVQQLSDIRPPVATTAIYSSQGIKLIEQGVTVDPGLYERLTRHQLSAPLEDQLLAQDSVNGKALRAAAEDLIGRRPVLAYLLGQPAARERLLDALESVPLPAPVAFQLTVARDVHPALFQYAVCTALLAGWLAGSREALRYDVAMVTAAGLVQDLGMLHIDPVLLNAEGPLTSAQRRQLYSHPLISGVLLERHHEYPRELIRAVREHHELLDGSGYPAGLAGEKISAWGRTLALAQVMSALLRPGRGLSALRLSLLLRTNRHQYDAQLCDRVLGVLRQLSQDGVAASPTEMASLEPVASPATRLITMDRLLADWPVALAKATDMPTPARAGMAAIGQQCEQMRRLLAEVGASAEQLAQLDSDAHDDEVLMSELSLIAQEVAWQLRTLTRNVGRRWTSAGADPLPPPLLDWLMRVDEGIAGLVEV
jgi:hypothetical protein